MALISVQNVRVSVSGKPIVDHVTFNLSPGDRIALVGPNGMGKTTFLKTLSGEMEPDSGRVEMAKDIRIVRLEQWQPNQQPTLYETAYQANPEVLKLEQELKHLEAEMADPANADRLEQLVDNWGKLSDRFQTAGGYEWESRVKAGLQKLGFLPERWADSPRTLSGGEAHRLSLLTMILSGAHVWLMDEPTNHLDIQTIGWLEDMVKQSAAAMIIVSHDRAFLDRVATRTMSWEDGSFWITGGNWTQYQRLREERLRQEALQWQRQQEEERRLRTYIDKWRSGTRARQAQSRQKRLDRLTQSTDRPAPPTAVRSLELTHQAQERIGHLPAVKIDHLVLTRGERSWQPVSLTIPLNARFAVVGPNGTGKTSLLEALMSSPMVHWHSDVVPAYLAQTAVQDLPEGVIAMDYAFDLGWDREQIYYLGARFGITQELWEQPLDTWSGGERARLKLLETLMTPAQALLLDEPTNHLDVRMREALERLLAEYPGTLIIASHDRAFLEKISTHTLWSTGTEFIFERMPYRIDRQPPTGN
ncbi:ABC-F family ATP-binding cassette domain-containing protein [Sulfobacillus harzensis]|uniref:ABC-F family ATP-binding cassette domain-containing protein n=1 Tax=Sulfobacillus harzensis TaxID=2729629 RepID=A0A7Y0Q3P9_9FIRM|nr:ABC-F family ATP-binding cassette domain-containing protein [Sulfobacillus harzensis]NMP23615.1 ABC-F family ATP-binding cassette domain-containing protein [Sulfobacillus harzensis]